MSYLYFMLIAEMFKDLSFRDYMIVEKMAKYFLCCIIKVLVTNILLRSLRCLIFANEGLAKSFYWCDFEYRFNTQNKSKALAM